MIELERFQAAICAEGLDGWLFYNFRQRDPLTNRLLGLATAGIATRPWYYLVPARGEPLKIVHAIEPKALADLPGAARTYSSRSELVAGLAMAPRGRWAAQFSEELPIVSFLDHGVALLLERSGLSLVSSAGLVQRAIGLIDRAGAASHERSSRHLYEIIDVVWRRIERAMADGLRTTEGAVQGWILSEFEARGLTFDHPPIVACGRHTADPHYEPEGEGGPLEPGEPLQLDIWAKERNPEAIYADISWVGFLGPTPPPELRELFDVVRRARDRARAYLEEQIGTGATVSGSQVDQEARRVLIEAGFEAAISHRTGHGIDRELHGSGVNLDSVEFPDHRPILEGSCFSIEPGLYLERFGARTEIDAYRLDSRLHVAGGPIQQELLLLSRGR